MRLAGQCRGSSAGVVHAQMQCRLAGQCRGGCAGAVHAQVQCRLAGQCRGGQRCRGVLQAGRCKTGVHTHRILEQQVQMHVAKCTAAVAAAVVAAAATAAARGDILHCEVQCRQVA